MNLAHFVITRFCVRDGPWLKRIDGPWFGPVNPLRPRNLALRLALLEMLCLPAILAQTNQNFTWVLLVDAGLPAAVRRQLDALAERKERTHIHEYRADGTEPVDALGWLRPAFPETTPDYVLTSVCDDDDALPKRYVETVQNHVAGLEPSAGEREGVPLARKDPPPFKTVASKQFLQWDMAFSAAAPRGWMREWRGARTLPDGSRSLVNLSPGFALLCRYPAFDFSVLGLKHALAETYFDYKVPPPRPNAAIVRSRFLQAARDAGIANVPSGPDAFFDASGAGAAVIANHGANLDPRRLGTRDAPQRVSGAENCPDAAIDWAATDRHAHHFRRPARAVRRLEQALYGRKGLRLAAAQRFGSTLSASLRRHPPRSQS